MKTVSCPAIDRSLVSRRDYGYAISYLADLLVSLGTAQRVCHWVLTRAALILSRDDMAWILGVFVADRESVDVVASRRRLLAEIPEFQEVADACARSAHARS